ncbi:MAG: S41 family peptidase [Dysgonamonadaceae bacterium]|jgi:hypothetical protein|nr:S41 family peptidase [Dysgonamonadaceae bacterium]
MTKKFLTLSSLLFALLLCLLIIASFYVDFEEKVILLHKKTDIVEYTIERTLDNQDTKQRTSSSAIYDSKTEYDGRNVSIFDIYKFAWKNATTEFIIPDELLFSINDWGYNVKFFGIDTLENFEMFRKDLDSVFELKTDLVYLDTIVLIINNIEESDRIQISDSVINNSVAHSSCQIQLNGFFSAKEISDCIKELSGLPVKMNPNLETENAYMIDSLSIIIGLPLDDLITCLKANGISVEKQKESRYFLKINNLCSDDSVFRYNPKQLENDANLFFKIVEEYHSNPYFRHGKEAFEKQKQHIFEQFKECRTREEFVKVMNTINPYLDPHTQLSNNYTFIQAVKGRNLFMEKKEFIFPDVVYKDGKIYSKIDNQEVEIQSINGYDISEMIDSVKSFWVNWTPNFEKLLVENRFPFLLPTFFDIHAPFTLGLKNGTKTIEGIPLDNSSCYKNSLEEEKMERNPLSFSLYPQSSIAILYVHTFDGNLIHLDSLDLKMRNLNDSLKLYNIKNLFIDVSKNMGGAVDIATKFLDYFQHDTLFCKHKWEGKLPTDLTEMYPNNIVSYPQKDKSLYDGKIVVLQGTRSYSGGDVFCRVVAENKLGLRIGKETSQYGKTFLTAHNQNFSYVNISFSYACGIWEFENFDDGLLQPDMDWNVDNTFQFSENELKAILKTLDQKIN